MYKSDKTMSKNNRRSFLKKVGLGFLSFSLWDYNTLFSWVRNSLPGYRSDRNVFFTTGFKISEVSRHSAAIWTRLCDREKPNPIVHKRRQEVFRHPVDFDEGQPVESMDGAVAGAEGYVRARVFNGEEENVSEWVKVKASGDYTAQISFDDLRENQAYQVEIEGRATFSDNATVTRGRFSTAPGPERVRRTCMVTSTCQYFWSFDDRRRGFRSYDSMRKLDPDFFIHTGDYVYYDKPGPLAKTLKEARHKWHAMDSRPSLKELYKRVPIYMVKDDHDLLKDDVFPGSGGYGDLSFEDGLKLWYENAPLQDKPYRTIRWGKDLQVWLVEGREYRSANIREDGPHKTIWGEEQVAWFKETMASSDATFKLLFSATPVVGPDRKNKNDNHANSAFETEGGWLREYLSGQEGTFVINGDRHWQYVSRDRKTGLVEVGSGPVSDYHAQGWDPNDVRPEHKFLRVKGGFLSITVDRKAGEPYISFRHHDVQGSVVNEEIFN